MTTPTMLPGLAEIAAQPVTRTAAAELPPHVKPGRTWRNTRTDERGTWHLAANRGEFADAICGAYIVRLVSPDADHWFAVGDEPASACRRCLAKAERLDAVAADEVDS